MLQESPFDPNSSHNIAYDHQDTHDSVSLIKSFQCETGADDPNIEDESNNHSPRVSTLYSKLHTRRHGLFQDVPPKRQQGRCRFLLARPGLNDANSRPPDHDDSYCSGYSIGETGMVLHMDTGQFLLSMLNHCYTSILASTNSMEWTGRFCEQYCSGFCYPTTHVCYVGEDIS